MAIRDETDEIKILHGLYCGLAGRDYPFRLRDHLYYWAAWRRRGWTTDDLTFLTKYLMREISHGNRHPGCLKFQNYIADLDRFEDDLLQARSLTRANQRKARTRILESTGRPDRSENNARTPADILKDKDFFEKCKREAGLI